MGSLRRFYTRIENEEIIQTYFFVLNSSPIEDECPVCYEVKNIETLSCHECKKCFHLDCIESWFKTNTGRTCPHCRTKWKFEIDIQEKPVPIHIELNQFTPIYRTRARDNSSSIIPRHRRDLTVRGTISGNIENRNNYPHHTIFPVNLRRSNEFEIEANIYRQNTVYSLFAGPAEAYIVNTTNDRPMDVRSITNGINGTNGTNSPYLNWHRSF